MSETLPAGIVVPLHDLAANLTTWAWGHPDASLATIEEAVMRNREPAAPVEEAAGILVVETDGVMVRYRDGWHEVKLGVVGGQVDGTLREPSYVAAREGPATFGPRLLAEAARRGALTVVGWEDARRDLARLRSVAVLGDGAV